MRLPQMLFLLLLLAPTKGIASQPTASPSPSTKAKAGAPTPRRAAKTQPAARRAAKTQPAARRAAAPTVPQRRPPQATRRPSPRPKGTMSCRQAGRYAVRHNPSFRVVRSKALIALQRLNASRIFPTNPELESIGKGKVNKGSLYKLEFALTWKFPIGGRWTYRQQIAKAMYKRVAAEIDLAQLNLILHTQKVCYMLLLQREKVQLYESMVAFYKRTYRYVKQQKVTGAATLIDLNLARLELIQSRASLVLAKASAKAKLQKLIAQLGWRQRRPPTLADPSLHRLRIKATLAQLIQRGQRQHAMLIMLKRSIDEYNARLKWAQAKAIPDLKFKLYYGYEEGENHVVGGGFAIPLPFAWRQQTKIWTGRAKLRQSRLKLRATRFKIRQEIKRTYSLFQAGYRVFQLYETQLVPTLKQQLRLRERGLRLGSFTILKVISAQQSQNKALLKRIDSLKQVLTNFITLQQSIGGLL